MKEYIKNKINLEKLPYVLGICFWIINCTFVQFCINMLLKVISASKSDWLNVGLKMELTNDPFIIFKTDIIVKLLIVVLILIIAFAIFSIVLFRNYQLKNMLSQIGMYRVLGYSKRKIVDICMYETIWDMILVVPVSILTSTLVWNFVAKIEIVSFVMAMINNSIWLDVSAFMMCAGFMIIVAVIHTRIFIERSMKKGIRYMLGQGVE